MNVDPMAEKYSSWSSYNYTLDNPINLIDPDGKEATDWIRQGNTVVYNSQVTNQEQATATYGAGAEWIAPGSEGSTYKSGNGIVVLGVGGSWTLNGKTSTAHDDALYFPVADGYAEQQFNDNSIMSQHIGDGKGSSTPGHGMFWSNPEQAHMWANSRAKTQAVNDLIEGMIYEAVALISGEEIMNVAFKGMYAGYKYLRAGKEILKETDELVKVYRVYGGRAREFGESWTTVNPENFGNLYRKWSGLPKANTGEKMIEGFVKWSDVHKIRPALPLNGNPGGLPELLIKDASEKIIRPSNVLLKTQF